MIPVGRFHPHHKSIFQLFNLHITKKVPAILLASTFQCLTPLSCQSATDLKYDEYSVVYDNLNGGNTAKLLGVDQLRADAAQYVSGDVLEVAVGTGLQVKYYNPNTLKSFTGVDQSQGMLKQAENKLASTLSTVSTRLRQMDAEQLQFNDDSFDTVVDTFSMCVIPRPESAIKEMIRVAKPSGLVVLLENTRSDNKLLGLFQDATEPAITKLSKECRWNTDIKKITEQNLNVRQIATKSIAGGTVQLNVYQKM